MVETVLHHWDHSLQWDDNHLFLSHKWREEIDLRCRRKILETLMFDFQGRKALEIFSTWKPVLGMTWVELSLPWSSVGSTAGHSVTMSQQVHPCVILSLYQLISLHNLLAALHLLGYLTVPVVCRESWNVSVRTPGVHSWQVNPSCYVPLSSPHVFPNLVLYMIFPNCKKYKCNKQVYDRQTPRNHNCEPTQAGHDVSKFECLLSLQMCTLNIC